jgi:hypothetical protein
MELVTIGLMLMVLLLIKRFIYDSMEISIHKYWILKAMAAECKEIDRFLRQLLERRGDYKIFNFEFRQFEKRFLSILNSRMFALRKIDSTRVRRQLMASRDLNL